MACYCKQISMKKLLLSLMVCILTPVLMASSCKKTTSADNPCEGVICTMMFAMITSQVVNSSGTPIQLDEAYTIRVKNNERLDLEQQMADGRYNVIDDSYQKQLANTNEDFTFFGVKDGKIVVQEPFTVGADCCHVKKQKGKDVIVVP